MFPPGKYTDLTCRTLHGVSLTRKFTLRVRSNTSMSRVATMFIIDRFYATRDSGGNLKT